MTDFVTILRSESGSCGTKTHTRSGDVWQTRSYRAGTWFDVYQNPVGSIFELRALLARLERKSDYYVIRGKLIKGRPAQGVRRLHCRETHGDEVNFEPAEHHWLLCDIDGKPAPAWLTPNDPESLRRAVTWAAEEYLPQCFASATVAYQWSRSAGVKPWSELRLALWFWTDRPVCDAPLKRWLADYCDASVYTPTQPHFTAAPVFVGAPDPLGAARSGLIQGAQDMVILPSEIIGLPEWSEQQTWIAEQQCRERQRRAEQIKSGARVNASLDDSQTFARGELDAACERIASESKGFRHKTIVRKSYRVGTLVAANLLDKEEAQRRLKEVSLNLSEANKPVLEGVIASGLDNAPAFDVGRLAKPKAHVQRRLDNLRVRLEVQS